MTAFTTSAFPQVFKYVEQTPNFALIQKSSSGPVICSDSGDRRIAGRLEKHPTWDLLEGKRHARRVRRMRAPAIEILHPVGQVRRIPMPLRTAGRSVPGKRLRGPSTFREHHPFSLIW